MVSVAIAAVAAAVGIVYSLLTHGRLVEQHLFTAGFVASAIVILTGLLMPAKAAFGTLRGNRRLDHATRDVRGVMEAKEERRAKGFEILFIGFGVFVITAAIEYLVWVIM